MNKIRPTFQSLARRAYKHRDSIPKQLFRIQRCRRRVNPSRSQERFSSRSQCFLIFMLVKQKRIACFDLDAKCGHESTGERVLFFVKVLSMRIRNRFDCLYQGCPIGSTRTACIPPVGFMLPPEYTSILQNVTVLSSS
jgi:hypothetical protein